MLVLAAFALFFITRGHTDTGKEGQRERERIAENYRKAKGYRCRVEVTLQKQVYKAELVRTKPDTLEITMSEPALLNGLGVKTTGKGFSVTYLGITAVYDELPDNISAFVGNVLLLLQILDGQLEAADGRSGADTMTLTFERPGGLRLYMEIDAGSYLPIAVTVERGEALRLSLNAFEFIY